MVELGAGECGLSKETASKRRWSKEKESRKRWSKDTAARMTWVELLCLATS